MVDRISSRIAGRFSGSITISRIALADICRCLWLTVYRTTLARQKGSFFSLSRQISATSNEHIHALVRQYMVVLDRVSFEKTV